jgi:hypothetical protein
MFGRKNKPEPEQGRDRRQVSRSGGSPAFSYYNNRAPEVTERRSPNRQDASETGKSRRSMPRSLAQLPFWGLILVAGLCLIKVLFLSTSPKVVLLGNTPVSATYVRTTQAYADAAHKQLTSSLTSHSKLTVNLNGTAEALERQFPELQAVSMTVPLVSSRPIVYVQVAQPSVVLQTASGNYALNKSGLVLAKLRSVPSGVPIVVDQSGASPVPGKQYLSSSTISFIQTVAYQLTAAKIDVSTYVLPASSLYELDAHIDGQPYSIKYNLQGDALLQSGAAIATMQHLGSTTPKEYIDVRVPDRVYYK